MAAPAEDSKAHSHASRDKDDAFSSPPYKFVVEGKAFYVHEHLIAQNSKPLAKMMQSSTLEGKEDSAVLEDVNQETFRRFVEWLYRGYYHAAMPTQLTSTDQPSEDGIVANTLQSSTSAFSFPPNIVSQCSVWTDAPKDINGGFEIPPKGASGAGVSLFGALVAGKNPQSTSGFPWGSRKAIDESVPQWQGPNPFADAEAWADPSSAGQKAKNFFSQRKYNVRQKVKSLPQPRQNKDKSENYSEVFLCHAHLHVFAEKYDIQPLKVLAVEELHAALAVFTLHQERTGDILNLLRYIYKEAPVQTNKMEDLRTLMTQYVDSEVETLIKDENLGKYLMEVDGRLLEDFLKVIRRRLV
ncbi:hypothetical protein G7Y79_00038g075320 [Physcia stellaris]|nr:hypothetical protein G7Y79_00038g075320 [Physcia stellaris]